MEGDVIDMDQFLECVRGCGTLVRRDVPRGLCMACTAAASAERLQTGVGAFPEEPDLPTILANSRRRRRVDAAMTLVGVVVVLALFGTPFVLGCWDIWAALWL